MAFLRKMADGAYWVCRGSPRKKTAVTWFTVHASGDTANIIKLKDIHAPRVLLGKRLRLRVELVTESEPEVKARCVCGTTEADALRCRRCHKLL
jgi:hypothetical protein